MKKYLQTKPGSLEEAVLISRGLITEAKYVMSVSDASFFKGNDIKKAMQETKKDGNSEKALNDLDMIGAGGEDITFTANNSSEAVRKAEKAILDYRNKETRNDRNALFAFNELELQEIDGKTPTSQQENMFKNVIKKYSNKAMFNTPNGRGPSDLQKFANDEALDDMAVGGVM